MKYIMLKIEEPISKFLPIIFPNELIHSDVANYMCTMLRRVHEWEAKVRSAGEINVEGECHGFSETLSRKAGRRIKAHADDTQIVSMYDYEHGLSSEEGNDEYV